MRRDATGAFVRCAGAALALGCATIGTPAAGEESDHRLYRAQGAVRFERHCADADAHQVQAYAELQSQDGRARALVRAYARHDAVRRDDIFIGARLVALRLHGAPRSEWSMHLELQSANALRATEPHRGYAANPASGEGEHRAFRTDATGTLDWLDFAERGTEAYRGLYPRNHSPSMETTAAALGLTGTAREFTPTLVLTALRTGAETRLPGPTMWIPDRIWHETPPKPKTLGLLAALNPFHKGGIIQTIARRAKYDNCIEERRAVKQRFIEAP